MWRRARPALILVAAFVAGAGAAATLGPGGPAEAQTLPGLPTTTTGTTPTGTTTTEPPPSQPPPATQTTPSKPVVTLTADRTDVLSRQAVRLSGRIAPPPEEPEKQPVQISGLTPGIEDSEKGEASVRLRADGTFAATVRPSMNQRYRAAVLVGNASYVSNAVDVFADYGFEVGWRRRSGRRLEVVALMTLRALEADYLSGRRLWFYTVRRRTSRNAHRLVSAPMFYTGDSSLDRPAAYKLFRPKRSRRFRYMLVCLARPLRFFGRPGDPIKRQCGNRRIRLP
jgi:hypothetical protein